MTTDDLLNDFAIRSFRDIGDGDYIAARMACRAGLVTQFLWASQQAIEKYLKCALLLNRIDGRDVFHDLTKAVNRINSSGKVTLDLTTKTQEFIARLDESGRYRYFEISTVAFGAELVALDRAAWELRRFCTLAPEPRQIKLVNGSPAPLVKLVGGHLEKISDDRRDPARKPLLWQNSFFGRRPRKSVHLVPWFEAKNSPLSMHPEILDEVVRYIFFPKDLAAELRRRHNAKA